MIIEPIIGNTITTTLTTGATALPWYQHLGYMVRPQTRRVQNGESSFTDVIYPVARHVRSADAAECPDPHLENMLPDSTKMSVIHIEALGPMTATPNEQIPLRQGVTFSQNIAVKVWFNHARFASEDGNDGHMALDVVRLLHGQVYRNVNIPLIIGDLAVENGKLVKMKVTWTSEMEHTPAGVWGAYTFSRDNGLFSGEYGFFGLTFNLSGIMITSCAMPAYAYDPYQTQC